MASVRVARSISQFEPVTMIANEADVAAARALCGGGINVEPAPIDDGWLRDNGPSFVINPDGRLAGVSWGFNGWGCKAGIPFERDQAVSRLILERERIDCIEAPLILEGGSFHVDGEGTLLTTEQCLLNRNRNPHLSRREVELHLENFLGVDTIIWLKQGLVDDITDGHIDLLAAFVSPGIVLALSCEDPADSNYKAIATNLEILRSAKDARGRSFEVIEVPQPPAAYNEATGTRLGLSHLNFYLANGAVILPAFGEEKSDARAAHLFREVFKDLKVVQVDARDLLYAGGNIHCITQQEPLASVTERSAR